MSATLEGRPVRKPMGLELRAGAGREATVLPQLPWSIERARLFRNGESQRPWDAGSSGRESHHSGTSTPCLSCRQCFTGLSFGRYGYLGCT